MLGLLWGYRLLFLLESDSRLQFARPTTQNILSALRNPIYNKIYLTIFLIFFCFASILNTLPFRLTELQQHTSELTIAVMYAGYLIGIIVVLNSGRINRWCRGESNSVLLGAILFLAALLLFNVSNVIFMFFNMFLLCAGMFLVHSVLAGYLNHLAVHDKGIVNGLYIALYYAGGASGSFFPGLIYRNFGWHIYLILLCGLVCIAMITVQFLPRAEPTV
jgi:YNFM family putative membrane transporter